MCSINFAISCRINIWWDKFKTSLGGQKSEKSHFFLRKKKLSFIVRFKSCKFFFFDPRPEKCPKSCVSEPEIPFPLVIFGDIALKNGHYLETRFSGKKIQKFCRAEISAKKKYFWSKLFFRAVYMKRSPKRVKQKFSDFSWFCYLFKPA